MKKNIEIDKNIFNNKDIDRVCKEMSKENCESCSEVTTMRRLCDEFLNKPWIYYECQDYPDPTDPYSKCKPITTYTKFNTLNQCMSNCDN